MARKVKIGKIDEIGGEEIEDERTQYDLEDEMYEDQVNLWLRQERSLQILELANFPLCFEKSDDFRAEKASSYGGFQIIDPEIQTTLRSAASDIVCQAASQAWAGNFKLSNLPFPIRASHGKTELQMQAKMMASTTPYYLNAAAATDDKVERMKLVMAHALSYVFTDHNFLKPVESQLGETVQAYGQDGSKLFLEQTKTEPPTSNYLFEGPNGNYQYSGYLEVNANPGLLSVHVMPRGFRKVKFHDEHTIVFNHHEDSIYNLTYGTMGHQMQGTVEFNDTENDLKGIIEFSASHSWSTPQDFITGRILAKGEAISTLRGNYMGFLDFDGVRYWDVREAEKWYFPMYDWETNPLPSDANRRLDVTTFKTKTVE